MTPLEWDSEFFGLRIARAELAELELGAALERARDERIDCLYLTVPGDRLGLAEQAIRRGARLVDLRTELDLDLAGSPLELAPSVRLAGEGDWERLAGLAERLSAYSRFRADPRFAPERVEEMYRIWVRGCLAEGAVAVPSGGEAGFVGARAEDGDVRVELVYVDPALGGHGIGSALVLSALAALGAKRARVVTQAGNIAAERFYQSLGFRTRSLEAILHLWLDELR